MLYFFKAKDKKENWMRKINININGSDIKVKNIRLLMSGELKVPEWEVLFEDDEIQTFDFGDIAFLNNNLSSVESFSIIFWNLDAFNVFYITEAQFGTPYEEYADEVFTILHRWKHEIDFKHDKFNKEILIKIKL
jgi:hypothetical protein